MPKATTQRAILASTSELTFTLQDMQAMALTITTASNFERSADGLAFDAQGVSVSISRIVDSCETEMRIEATSANAMHAKRVLTLLTLSIAHDFPLKSVVWLDTCVAIPADVFIAGVKDTLTKTIKFSALRSKHVRPRRVRCSAGHTRDRLSSIPSEIAQFCANRNLCPRRMRHDAHVDAFHGNVRRVIARRANRTELSQLKKEQGPVPLTKHMSSWAETFFMSAYSRHLAAPIMVYEIVKKESVRIAALACVIAIPSITSSQTVASVFNGF